MLRLIWLGLHGWRWGGERCTPEDKELIGYRGAIFLGPLTIDFWGQPVTPPWMSDDAFRH